MNRRSFVSLLAGTAGASLVPWRTHLEPLISLPPRRIVDVALHRSPAFNPYTYEWTWLSGGGLVVSREVAARLSEGLSEVVITDSAGRISRACVNVSISQLPPI